MSHQDQESAVMDIKQVADVLQVSMTTVRNWIRHNYIIPVSPKGRLRFASQDVYSLKENLVNGDVMRLRKRANKDQSTSTCLPLEYLSNAEKANDVENAVRLILENGISLDEGLFFLALNLLSKEGLLAPSLTAQEMLSFKEEFFYHNQIKAELKNWANCIKFETSPNFQNKILTTHIPKVQDFLGVVYQTLRAEGNKAKAGAYYTPLQIVKEITDTYINEKDFNAQILDPCCGTGQFLLIALNRLAEINKEENILSNVWGVDVDDTAVRIARINVLLRCKNQDNIPPNIYCKDALLEERIIKDDYFSLIITNPPWGARLSKSDQKGLADVFPYIKSGETFSYFIAKGIRALKANGVLSYILPESFLNVKAHSDIRQKILEQTTINKIVCLNRVFKNVFTPVIKLDIQKKPPQLGHIVKVENGQSFEVEQKNFSKGRDFIFYINLNNKDAAVLDKVYSQHHSTLSNNAEWALGIVTGDNAKFLSNEQSEGFEGIIKGKDVLRFLYQPPSAFVKFEPEKFQQVAPTAKYRSKEKLVYKFISKELVFAYDDKQTLTLNSANIVIPKSEKHPLKFILGLFNSSLYQFIFQKKINSIKVLKSHIEMLPLPHWSDEGVQTIVAYVNTLLKPGTSNGQRLKIYEMLDSLVMTKWGLEEDEREYVLNNVDVSKHNYLRG